MLKNLQSQSKRRILQFSPTLERKNKTHQHTGDTDRKENERVDKFNTQVLFGSNNRTDRNRQCITQYIKNWVDTTEIKDCSLLQTLYRFDSDVLRSANFSYTETVSRHSKMSLQSKHSA